MNIAQKADVPASHALRRSDQTAAAARPRTTWVVLPFDEFAVLQRGQDLTKSQFQPGKVPVAGSNGVIGFHNCANVAAPGVTIGRSGSVGKVSIYDEPFWAHNTCLYVRDFCGNDARFTYYFLQHLDVGRFKSGASVPTLDRNSFRTIPVSVPPLHEQRKIAAVLSAVQGAIERQERLIALSGELKKALMHQLFTAGTRGEPLKRTEIGMLPINWDVRRFDTVFDSFDGDRVPVKQSDRVPGPYPYYGASGIVDYVNDFRFDGEYLLVAEDGENLESRKLPIAFIAKGKFWVNNHAHVVRNRVGNLHFFAYFISQMAIRDYLSGTTRPKLNKAQMMSILLPYPPEDEQVEIADLLNAAIRKADSHDCTHAALTSLFGTLLQQLMTGQIRVRDLDLSALEEAVPESAVAA